MLEDHELLGDYARNRSESAFSELVRRNVDLVFSAALRETHGDGAMAEDITQTVFVELSSKASCLCHHPALAGWLYTCVRQMSANARRSNERRQRREQEAHSMNELFSADSAESTWQHVQPVLDDAMHDLNETDRAAVVLRFFKDRSHKDVGLALGLTESAARKRVDRALERLRELLARRGVTVGAGGLGVVLSAHAVQAAPVGLAAAVAMTVALAGTTISTTATATALKTIAMTTLQKTLLAILVVAGLVTPVVLYKQSSSKQRAANEALNRQTEELARQQAEKDRLSALATQADPSTGRSNDLLRLRAEAESLRKQTNALPVARAENRRLQAVADMPEVEPSEAEKTEVMGKMADSKSWAIASFLYSRKNQGQLPPTIDQAVSFFPDKAKLATNSTAGQFDIVYQGSLKSLAQPQSVIVIRQKQALAYGNRWAKVYGYGDGHVEMRVQADRDFDSWEKQHIESTTPRSP